MERLKWIVPTCLSVTALALHLFDGASGAPPDETHAPPVDVELTELRARIARLGTTLERLEDAKAHAQQDGGAPPVPLEPTSVARPVEERSTPPSEGPRAAAADTDDEAPPDDDDWRPPERESVVFDINRDGEVTPDEVERGEDLALRAAEFAQSRSSDGSYPIVADDFRGHPKLFAAMDANGDGALTQREATTYFVDSIRELRRYDQNYDGALALSEFGHLDSRFDFLDTNHDQKIEAWEINILRARGKW